MREDEKHEKEDVEIDPLSDEDLESVPGGAADCSGCCGTGCCTSSDGDATGIAVLS